MVFFCLCTRSIDLSAQLQFGFGFVFLAACLLTSWRWCVRECEFRSNLDLFLSVVPSCISSGVSLQLLAIRELDACGLQKSLCYAYELSVECYYVLENWHEADHLCFA